MNVAELRKALEGLPDDMPVVGHDEGDYTIEDVTAGSVWLAPDCEDSCILQCIKIGGGRVGPNDPGAVLYFVVT